MVGLVGVSTVAAAGFSLLPCFRRHRKALKTLARHMVPQVFTRAPGRRAVPALQKWAEDHEAKQQKAVTLIKFLEETAATTDQTNYYYRVGRTVRLASSSTETKRLSLADRSWSSTVRLLTEDHGMVCKSVRRQVRETIFGMCDEVTCIVVSYVGYSRFILIVGKGGVRQPYALDDGEDPTYNTCWRSLNRERKSLRSS